MMTMGSPIDRVQPDEIKPKASQIGDLVMHVALKSGLTPEGLQRVVERGGELQVEVKKILRRLATKVGLVSSKLLEPVTNVSLSAVPTFSATEHFLADGKAPSGVKLYLGDNFSQAFLSGGGKVETDVPEVSLRIHKLRMNSLDAPIIAELGGEQVVEVALAHVWKMIEVQGQGQQGYLHTNGYANIFYVRDIQGTLWAVRCWNSANDTWHVQAYPVTGPGIWFADGQVFSH